MTDFTYDRGPAAASHSRNVASMANWAGAAVSLALVVGVGVWGYKLLARDVSGVPIVQAMEGPMRVAPKDPGGTLADHQGLAVNKVAGMGTAPPPEQVMLAPRPAGLSEEDVATGALIVPQQPVPMRASLAEQSLAMEVERVPQIAEDGGLGAVDVNDPLHALVAQLTSGSEPLSALSDAEAAPAEAALADIIAANETDIAAAPKPGPGLARSLRPKLRPSGLQVASLDAAPVVAAAASAVRELDAEALATGTRLVQIGAFDSPETARAEWQRLDARFGDYLEGKDRVIQRASSGGRVFYRLRAHGFADLSDARRFCAAFVAGNVDCIPVVTR